MYGVFIDVFLALYYGRHILSRSCSLHQSDGSNGRKYVASTRLGLDLMVFGTHASVELHEVRFVVAKHSTQVQPIADNWCIKELNMIIVQVL